MSVDQSKGLTHEEAHQRLQEYGLNELVERNKVTPFKILIRQFKNNFVFYLLLGAAIISLFVGKDVTAYVIFGVITVVIIVGFFLEYRAEQALQTLKSMVTRLTTVIRDGTETQIPSREIVPGDILVLKTGEYIPADSILIEEKELYVNESVLTGESREVPKNTQSSDEDERTIYMGTYIVNGRCIAEVVKTGMQTRFGGIAELISKAEKDLPLQNDINKITKYMITVALTFSFLTGIFMVFNAGEFSSTVLIEILVVVIALAVSAVPEGLPVVLVTTLASGALRMAQKNAIVNRMAIIGTVGEVTVICSDKTGTITKGEMTVKKIFTPHHEYNVEGGGYNSQGKILLNNDEANVDDHANLQELIKAAVLCNDAKLKEQDTTGDYSIEGTPTEAALLVLGVKAGKEREDYQVERVEEIPFSSSRKIMSVLISDGNLYTKGAPEVVLEKSSRIFLNGEEREFTSENRQQLQKITEDLAKKSYRTLALAFKKGSNLANQNDENNFIFLGIVAIEDPAREEVKAAITECAHAGIKVKMITGDNKETATAIAQQIGLNGNAIEGTELDTLSDEELKNIVTTTTVFARVRPEHKVRIVQALKKHNEIVAMTGDGVNDAPALKEAHVGIAMGKNGTDVSRSVADITLKDDNFATIVTAIREGRGIFENIRTFVSYQLSCNLAQLTIIFLGVVAAPFFGWEIPILVALQILFVNIITDSIPAITLGLMPPSHNIMKRAPHRHGLVTPFIIRTIIFAGLLTGTVVIAIYAVYKEILGTQNHIARSVAFASFVSIVLANAFSFRAIRTSIIRQFNKDNLLLLFAAAIGVVALIIIIYSPLNTVFEVVSLRSIHWVVALCAIIFAQSCFEIYKALQSHKS